MEPGLAAEAGESRRSVHPGSVWETPGNQEETLALENKPGMGEAPACGKRTQTWEKVPALGAAFPLRWGSLEQWRCKYRESR